MRPLDFPLLADENISPAVIGALRARGKDVRVALAEGLGGQSDAEILRRAHAEGRVVVTHDRDFGTLVVGTGESFTGIVYLRPGHIATSFVLEMIAAAEAAAIDAEPPFILVVERRAEIVRLRFRCAVGT